LTADLAARARAHIEEVEKMGAMVKAIEAGLPKMRIEEAAAKTQARIDSGRRVIVGGSHYRLRPEEEVKDDLLKVDNSQGRAAQTARLKKLRAERDERRVQQALDALTRAAETGEGNLLELSVEAARAHATVGEISYALEKVFGRYQATSHSVQGVYERELGEERENVDRVRDRVEAFARREGRRPRILVAKMGQDGHDRGQKVIASALADLGFDVDIGPLFQTPEETARQAVENDVHVVGVSSL